MTDGRSPGISPVMGIIIMVALATILAAVIGTFVLDLDENVHEEECETFEFKTTEVTGYNADCDDGPRVVIESTSNVPDEWDLAG